MLEKVLAFSLSQRLLVVVAAALLAEIGRAHV